MSFVVWGMFVRMVYVLHVTWFVNSATHMWGYRNYETTDDSRNLWWVGLLAFGEGWHNNHHAYQRMARQGHRWWEFDITYWAIWLMEKVGLAWDVVHEVPQHTPPCIARQIVHRSKKISIIDLGRVPHRTRPFSLLGRESSRPPGNLPSSFWIAPNCP